MGTITDLFARADWFAVRFPPSGKWWADRASTKIPDDGELTIWLVGETEQNEPDRLPPQAVRLTGTPDTLRRVASAIISHVESAETNTAH